MAVLKKSIQSIACIAAFGFAAFFLVFTMREVAIRDFLSPPPPIINTAHPATDLANCVNDQPPPSYLIMRPTTEARFNARVIERSESFTTLTIGRSTRGRWVFAVDTRGEQPLVYDVRLQPVPVLESMRDRASFQQTTEAFEACGAEYIGEVPVPQEEWATWFGDPFFENYERWNRWR
ncbi:hypothetical protein [Gymnodinialimonas ulvae]|uniref:hypothetical protein n=1 Tax=Gymnodinialimonas ulvae TaxID=3126504 RepID=UPI00309AD98A